MAHTELILKKEYKNKKEKHACRTASLDSAARMRLGGGAHCPSRCFALQTGRAAEK
jgi:hypothetical protein